MSPRRLVQIRNLTAILVGCVWAGLSMAAPAEFQADFYTYPAPLGSTAPLLADLNQDGHADVVLRRGRNPVDTLEIRYGTAGVEFVPGPVFATTYAGYAMAAVDMNQDGKVDLVTGGVGMITIHLGNGDGTFGPGAAYGTNDYTLRGLAVADFDGDGLLDAATGSSGTVLHPGNGVRVWHGNGNGTVGAWVDYKTGGFVSDLVAGDLNGDGRTDLVATQRTTLADNIDTLSVLLRGPYVFAPAVHYPTISAFIGIGDMDEDGHLDLVNASSFFHGNGDGTFAPRVDFDPELYAGAAIADVDGDGHLDVTAMGYGYVSIHRGHGDGTFSPGQESPNGNSFSYPQLADLDADGRLDVIAFSSQGFSVTLGHGDGWFGARHEIPIGHEVYWVQVADVTWDGHADIIALNPYIRTLSVLPGNGHGGFAPPQEFESPAGVPWFRSLAVGDVDGDGHPDIVTCGDSTAAIDVFLSTGGGALARTEYPAATAGGLLAADLDLDGRADVVTMSSDTISTFLAQPGGVLGPHADYGPYYGWDMAAGDLNGDQHPDLVVLEYGQKRVRVLINDGSGGFVPGGSYSFPKSIFHIALGDANGDGHLDVLLGDRFSILLGLGDGTFGPPTPPLPVGYQVRGIAAGDLDQDGLLDVVILPYDDDACSVYLGTGGGAFGEHRGYGVGVDPWDVAIADVDENGYPDLVTANFGSGDITVLRNLSGSSGVATGTRGRSNALRLAAPWPNPTAHAIQVAFNLPSTAPATIELLDVAGRQWEFQRLASRAAGTHRFVLARDRMLPVGVYLVRVTQGRETAVARAIVVR